MKPRLESASHKSSAKQGGREVSSARRAAYEILRRVEDDGAYASVLLAANNDDMRPDDRALCYELVMGVLRWQLWLDALIKRFIDRDIDSLDGPIRRILRVGLYELRFLTRIPASATVNEAVNLAYHARVRSAAGFVNAVLRRAIREGKYDPTEAITDPIERLSIATSHPVWLLDRWVASFGSKEAAEFAQANNAAPPVTFRICGSADEASVLESLRESGVIVTPSSIALGAWRANGSTTLLRKLSNDALIYLQDEASQLVAHVVAAQSNDRVLDVCAAPGSKTSHIADLTPGAAMIVAGDRYEHRLKTVNETAKRLGVERIHLLVHDATIGLPLCEQSFDRVLVDAPCSGTGTLRRNPEIRWRISTQDISELSAKQGLILTNSAVAVRRGGRLVYSTCSVEVDENENIVNAFLRDNKDFAQVQIHANEVTRTAEGSVRTWPHKDGADGFFVAAFQRQA